MTSISFAIITAGDCDARIEEIIDSIEITGAPADILIVGGEVSSVSRARHIAFDETQRPGWITRKKNIATMEAQHEDIVYLHDYHVFDPLWYQAVLDHGPEYDVQMHSIFLQTGERTFDWVIHDHPILPPHVLVPYDRLDLIPHQYISGGYWMAKKSFMLEQPLNEQLLHHGAEDLEWSRRIRDRYRITMNARAIVRHNKIHRECAVQSSRKQLQEAYDWYFR